jgi:hypothetical protein
MAENRFAKYRTQQAPQATPQGQNRFAKYRQAAAQQSPVASPQEPVTVNIADKTDFGGPSAAQKSLGNQYSPMTQGMSLGASDEMYSGLMAPVDAAVNYIRGNGPTGIGENYQQRKAQMDAEKAAYERDNPTKAFTGEVAGGLMTGGFGGKFIQGAKSLMGTAGRSALIGGGIGGAQGFASTDGNLEDREKGAVIGAGTGAVLGGILPPVFATTRALAKSATAPIRSLADPKSFAAKKVAEALARDNMSMARVGNRLASNSAIKGDLSVADVAGGNTADLLRVAADMPSKARRSLEQQIEYRQDNQLSRLQSDIGDAFGNPEAFHKTTENVVLSRKSAAKPLFDTAFQTPTPYTVNLENVLNRPLTKQLVERARIAAANRGENFKNIFVNVSQDGSATARRVIDTQGLHRVKMTIDEMMSALKKGQPTGLDNANMRDLTILKKDLLSAMDNQPYKQALSQYAGDSAMANALDDGFENGLKLDPEMIRKTLSNLSNAEQELWRLGFSRSISDMLRDTGRNGTNRADILMSPKIMQRINAASPDAASRRELMQKVKLEQRMYRTRNTVTGNSKTARFLAQSDEAGVDAQNAQDIIGAGKDVLQGNVVGAAIKFLGRAKNRASGLSPAVADEVIRLLTTRKPADLIAAQRLIKRAQVRLERSKGQTDLLDGLRAVSAGLLTGRIGEHATTQ